ncbi:MAG: hypothetical protein LBJ03_00975 [Holosporales bacterium]|jgi:hypothetical protein|nr:hypothetical protein [Holosporales bacterium]
MMQSDKAIVRICTLFLSIFGLATLACLFATSALVYIADPLCYWRYDPNMPLYWDSRYQVAAFIKTLPFEAAIIATSMGRNYSITQISKELRVNPVNLTIIGACIHEQLAAAKAAIKNGKAKSIIWSFDRFSLIPPPSV